MSVDHIRYDLLTQEALRSVLRRVLQDAAKNGLPGDHHFYVSFNTTAPGVRLSKRLRAQYPDEMTIVLQHQYRDLSVNEEGFEVGLSFSGVSEHLVVPFSAIKRFFDPSVQFGLQFETVGTDKGDVNDEDVRLLNANGMQGRRCLLGFATYRQIGFTVNELCQPLAHNGMIINHEHL